MDLLQKSVFFASGKPPKNTSAPEMFFGRNLHLIGPFDLFPAGFSTEFQRASFVFLRPRADFRTPGQNLGPRGRHFGLGTFWGQLLGPEKYSFARIGFFGEDTGESPTPK